MKKFEDKDRYEYDLMPDDVVIDAGGYEGNFAGIIGEKYCCHVELFEPVPRFMTQIWKRIAHLPKVRPNLAGLGATTRFDTFHVQRDSSGLFAGASEVVTAQVLAITDLLEWKEFERGCALMKLNVEGAEFEILEALIKPENQRLLAKVRNIQVQFHPIVPEYGTRYVAIRDALLRTHEMTYCEPWCWENYCLLENP